MTHPAHFLRGCVFLGTFLILASSFSYHLASAQWLGAARDTLTHDSLRDENPPQSFAIDNTNTLHAIWQRTQPGQGWRAFYSRKGSSSHWTAAREVGDSTMQLYHPALAVDKASGTAWVVFSASYGPSDEIVVAKDSAGVWRRNRLTINATQDLSPSISCDTDSKVHVAWIGQDSAASWKIFYATNLKGSWNTQMLSGSELGQFGSGAAPWVAVTPSGTAHIFYRGGNYLDYHIHHASNRLPGDTAWTVEIIATPNANDLSAVAVVTNDGHLHLLANGNDGFGFPPRVYYLRKPPGGNWTQPELATPGGNGVGRSLVVDEFGKIHVAWDEISGNVYTGNAYYATNKTGRWAIAPVAVDGRTYNGYLVIDALGKGHVLAFNGETFPTQEIIAIHSAGGLTHAAEGEPPRLGQATLEQNYPNPFNPSTTVGYSLPGESFVTLAVYNALGQQVASIVQGQHGGGHHTALFRSDGLPSGVYFYRLSVSPAVTSAFLRAQQGERDIVPTSRDGRPGSFIQTRKMLVVK